MRGLFCLSCLTRLLSRLGWIRQREGLRTIQHHSADGEPKESFLFNYLSLTIRAARATQFRHQFPVTPGLLPPVGLQIRAALQLNVSIGCLQSVHTCGDFKHDGCLNLRPLWLSQKQGEIQIWPRVTLQVATTCCRCGYCFILRMTYSPYNRLVGDHSSRNAFCIKNIGQIFTQSTINWWIEVITLHGWCSVSLLDEYILIPFAISHSQFVWDYFE